MDNSVKKLLSAASLAEDHGNDDVSYLLHRVAREITSARQTEVNINSWTEFVNWWNNNRSQDLIFSLADQLGTGHPAIQQLDEIGVQMDELEKKLHDVYLLLKNKSDEAPVEPSLPVEEAPVSLDNLATEDNTI